MIGGTPRGLALTVAGAVALAATGVAAARHSLGLTLANRNPAAAVRADGENALALGEAALARVQLEPTPAGVAAARAMAVRAIRRDPTNSSGLAVIGLATRTDADARRAFTLLESYTRRSLPAQLFLIEDAVRRNDIDGALRHYDIALKTSKTAPGILFPVLVQASTDPELIPAITRTLAARPLWGWQFLQQVAQSSPSLPTAATLFADLKRRGVDPGAAATATLYDRLIEARAFDPAWRLYAAGAPAAARAGIRNPVFADAPDNPAPFDWRTSDDGSVSARIERIGASAGQLLFSAASGEGGEAAQQLLLLAPGSHRVRIVAEGIRAPADALPFAKLVCVATGADLARTSIPAGEGRTAATLAVTVPAGCAAQRLVIGVQPPATMDAVEGAIRSVSLD